MEEQDFIDFLKSGGNGSHFSDDLYARSVQAWRDRRASVLDRAVLLRQVLRRWSLRDGRDVSVELDSDLSGSLQSVADAVGLRNRRGNFWTARAWNPGWLDLAGGIPDSASLAGEDSGRRFQDTSLQADPFFEQSTGFAHYRTPGQRVACRAAVTVPEGSTIIAMLPTGSGKTEIALCLADRLKAGVTVIVVPTVALAYDFERRFRDHFFRRLAGKIRGSKDSLNFAWTGTTNAATRDALKLRILNGQQPILVTSPESVTRALRHTLLEAAALGRLKGFVVDEAHLVTQWGRSFRPEFRTLADLRRDLLKRAVDGGHDPPISLLLSATLGSTEMSDLIALFGEPGPCIPITANSLRSEPEIWIAPAKDQDERESWVIDALAHCSRPAVLYVTKPEVAEEWAGRLRNEGYARLATVTGLSTPEERSAVLSGIRVDSGDARGIDLVVATSAFGLGIDYPHLRTIVHACLPETVDRWYQELGRAGRDGSICASFLLTAPGDEPEADSLGVKVLTPKTAKKRWDDLWNHKRTVAGRHFLDLEGARGSVRPGDFNRLWNAQVVQGLVELGELQRMQFDLEDLAEVADGDGARVSDWISVERISARLGATGFWDDTWQSWQRQEMDVSKEALALSRKVALLTTSACQCVVEAYTPAAGLLESWPVALEHMAPTAPCGRCPHCRAGGVKDPQDPPPSPEQSWPVFSQGTDDLERFVAAARGRQGCAFVTYSEESEALVTSVAQGLALLGVRHFGGLEEVPTSFLGSAIFQDEEPLTPLNLTPVSTLSLFRRHQQVSNLWNRRRARPRCTDGGVQLFDVLLVPASCEVGGQEVGRDIQSIGISTAVELLPKG